MMGCNKEMGTLIDQYLQLGWTAENPRRGGHVKMRSPRKRLLVVCAKTPSDRRTVQNTRALLRRAHENDQAVA